MEHTSDTTPLQNSITKEAITIAHSLVETSLKQLCKYPYPTSNCKPTITQTQTYIAFKYLYNYNGLTKLQKSIQYLCVFEHNSSLILCYSILYGRSNPTPLLQVIEQTKNYKKYCNSTSYQYTESYLFANQYHNFHLKIAIDYL